MFKLEGENQAVITVDGAWLEKRRGANPSTRLPLDEYRQTTVKDYSRRKFVAFGAKEELLQVLIDFGGKMVTIHVPASERGRVDELVSLLEAGKVSQAGER
jgi:hypothetical protein